MDPSSSPNGHYLSHSDEGHVVDPNGRPLRLYQIWRGRNKFLCGGRLIFGPDIMSIFLTLFLILGPVFLFWAFVAPGIINAFPRGHGLFVVLFSFALTLHIIIFLFLTSGRDPGIIPKNSYPPDLDDTSSTSTDWSSGQFSNGIPLIKSVIVNGVVVKVKYCPTCMVYRPPRCSHCSICDNCVECFDHHCPWVGQCIGKRNYRHFFMFVSGTTCVCLYVLVWCLIYIKKTVDKEHCTVWKAILKSPVSATLVVYTFFICWFVGGLTTFHFYLIAINQTTYENFRYRYEGKRNPYRRGVFENFKEAFCTKVPESRNNFKEFVRWDPGTEFSMSPYLAWHRSPSMSPETLKRVLAGEMDSRSIVGDDCEDMSTVSLDSCGTKSNHDESFTDSSTGI